MRGTLLNSGLVLIGAGGHARSLSALIKRDPRNLKISKYVSLEESKTPIFLDLEHFQSLGDLPKDREPATFLNGLGTSMPLSKRHSIYSEFLSSSLVPLTVISDEAYLDEDVVIGEGCQIFPRSIVRTGSRLGDDSVINTGAIIEHDVQVGAGSFIAPGAIILGGCILGTGVLVGSGAIIHPGVVLGKNCIIGSGAVVLANVDEGVTVVGIPGRPIRL